MTGACFRPIEKNLFLVAWLCSANAACASLAEGVREEVLVFGANTCFFSDSSPLRLPPLPILLS